MARKTRKALPWFRVVVLCLILLAVVPVLEVLYVRFFNPPITTLMVFRRIEAMITKRHRGDIHYRWIPLDRVPDDFLDGVWQMEDSRFFIHGGFDWIEMEKAIHRAEEKHRPVQGVSTITNQCARSLFLWQGRSWIRKGFEAYYTFLMEHLLTKERILELYVNVIELGDGIYGIGEAADHYYHLPAKELSRSECAMLAAMLPFPRGWDPHNPSPRLRARYSIVVRRMNAGGPIERKLGE
ncbi:MAG TPA: monofunctional biosynthetic peptidoglycan transglycosylase [Chthoniobacterales bacterium]|nr:monofunctional biosynthetic peptidoglycan transglycosylase [Chthoniobacterales bacterium]